MKVLILRFSSIGDIVLTSPVMRCLNTQLENVEIHFATKKSYQSIVANNPYVHQVHVLGENINDLIKELQEENFDYIIDLHNNLRTQIIKIRLRTKSFSVNKLNFEKWLLTQFKIDKLPKYKHIVDRYLYTVKSLGVSNDGQGLEYFIPSEDEVFIADLFEDAKNGYVAIAIGAKFSTKRLPYQKIIDVCNQINMPIILLGGIDDLARGEEVKLKSNNPYIFNACGKLNLNQSASVVKQANVVLTNDTGLMHVAAAFNKNIVSVWGNTVPELGMFPYLAEDKFKTIQVENLSCRPCSKIGYKKCPKGHFDCMKKIDTQEIISAINYYLELV